ncbi:MAG: hypothetical protein QMC77_08565 [Methanocellales archaeon]|nr:hypothetical protein [Methanocellales archaeon]
MKGEIIEEFCREAVRDIKKGKGKNIDGLIEKYHKMYKMEEKA